MEEGVKGEGGGRVSKIWILALPGSISESSLTWKQEYSIFGVTNRKSSHDSFTSLAQHHSQAGCRLDESPAHYQGHSSLHADTHRQRATPTATGEQLSPGVHSLPRR